MEYFNVGMGLFFIVLAFLVRKYPNLIAGYNTLPEHQKKKVDIDGLSSHMRNVFIGMGILIMLSNPFLDFFGLQDYGDLSIILIVLIGTLFMFINAQTFRDKSEYTESKKVFRVLLAVGFIILIGVSVFRMITKGTQSPEFQISGDQITISGMYGTTSTIMGIALLDTIPRIERKTNGFNFGPVLKGSFELEKFGPGRLYIESQDGPFIFIKTDAETPIIINLRSKQETKDLFKELTLNFENETE